MRSCETVCVSTARVYIQYKTVLLRVLRAIPYRTSHSLLLPSTSSFNQTQSNLVSVLQQTSSTEVLKNIFLSCYWFRLCRWASERRMTLTHVLARLARIARRGRRIFLRPHRHRETDGFPLQWSFFHISFGYFSCRTPLFTV